MAVTNSEVGYISATTGRGDHEVHKGHVVALKKKHGYSNSKLVVFGCHVILKFWTNAGHKACQNYVQKS
jgi:hypothetical protein